MKRGVLSALLSTGVTASDESSMLQMPVQKTLDTAEDECRCPGYYETQCVAEAAQGCFWSSDGGSDEPWCQCGPVPELCCQAMTAACLACSDGITEHEYCVRNPGLHDCPVLGPAFELVMKAATTLFEYDSEYWENTETLNPTSGVDEVEDAKYPTFMTSTFNIIRMCVGGPATQCIDHRLGFTWNSAHELFTAGDIRDQSIDQAAWLAAFEAGNRENVLCPMQKAGFNSRCKDSNRVRFGWCNNIFTQACQSEDHDDADGTIGIGLHGQGGGHTGAGHTNGFANSGVGSGTERTIPTWVYVAYETPVYPEVHYGTLVMKAVTDLFEYNSPYWENTDTLNPQSALEIAENAKYPAFMTERFNTITMCVGGPVSNCVSHSVSSYESAQALFTAGYIRDQSIDQEAWLSTFDAGNRANVLCPMQNPGFNSECLDGNKVRFGWCNNIYTQACQSGDTDDADGTIGLGLMGQGGGHTGAGLTNGFANNGVGAGTERTIPTWIYVAHVDRVGQGGCWSECGDASGLCNWCGVGNACCRQGWSQAQPAECGEDRAQYSGLFTSGHECVTVSPAPPAPPPARPNYHRYVRGGQDGSCPAGTDRVPIDECPQLDGESLTDRTLLSNSHHRVDCQPHFVNGAGCFVNIHSNVYSTAENCPRAQGTGHNHWAVCKELLDDESWCAAQCQAEGYCCNDPSIGSNQQISCAQACVMRASGQGTDAMLTANGGICDRAGNSGCELQVQGQDYGFCGSCQDKHDQCPHGVQSSDECDFGANLLPPSAVVD